MLLGGLTALRQQRQHGRWLAPVRLLNGLTGALPLLVGLQVDGRAVRDGELALVLDKVLHHVDAAQSPIHLLQHLADLHNAVRQAVVPVFASGAAQRLAVDDPGEAVLEVLLPLFSNLIFFICLLALSFYAVKLYVFVHTDFFNLHIFRHL